MEKIRTYGFVDRKDITAHREQSIRWRKAWRVFLTLAVLLWVSVLILFPFFGIIREAAGYGVQSFLESLRSPESVRAFGLTAILTVSAVLINTLMGLCLALVFARTRFRGKLMLESIVDLPFAVSPVVSGFMFILLLGPEGWIGNWFESVNIKLIYALPGMVMANLFVTLPFVLREILPILREFGREQEEAAAILGASGWQTFLKVTLPSIRWGLAYGITLTISRSIAEFGAVLVVRGSIINKTQTATLRIHEQFSDLNYAGAFSAALVLATVSFLILVVIQLVYKKKERN